MSAAGVRNRMIDMIIRNRGLITERGLRDIDDYARRHRHTTAERRATVQPASYLARSRRLYGAGIRADEVAFESAEAHRYALALARGYGLEPFPGVRGPGTERAAQPPASQPEADAGGPTPATVLREALARSERWGPPSTWRARTPSADVAFHVDLGDLGEHPAVVLSTPKWTDPAPRALVREHAGAFVAARTLDDFEAAIGATVAREARYLLAEGEGRNNNETYAIQALRRRALGDGLVAMAARLPARTRDRAKGIIRRAMERLVLGRRFEMDVGARHGYWPYWASFLAPLVRLAEQAPRDSSAHAVLQNRIRDVLRRKVVFNEDGVIDERDLERTASAAVVYRPRYSAGVGHRISLAEGLGMPPQYELLAVEASGLPVDLRAYAGRQVYRDGGDLLFDHPDASGARAPEPAGTPLPRRLRAHVRAARLAPEDLWGNMSLRPLEPGERAREGISADWDGNGVVNLAKILIDWWGHCHNEAPGNAMGIDPKKPTTVYVSDRGVPGDAALQTFTADDAWDVFGALAADAETGYAPIRHGRPVGRAEVGATELVGARNDGRRWLQLDLRSGTRVRLDAALDRLWAPDGRPVEDPMSAFRRYLPEPDGTFRANPDYVLDTSGGDDIDIDATGRAFAVTVRSLALGADGQPARVERSVSIDPAHDGFITLAEQLTRPPGRGPARLIEHRYHPARRQYERLTHEVAETNRRRVARAGPVDVERLVLRQEATYDSADALHGFIMDRTGLPFTVDTAAGMTVWNHAVSGLRVEALDVVERVEDGEAVDYTTYQLSYDTVGGPSDAVRYIIKRAESGETLAATAIDPMPDFAFRHEAWVMAPVALDAAGRPVVNVKALQAGYLTDRAGRLDTSSWLALGRILYASLTDRTPEAGALLFIDEQGQTRSFQTPEDFRRAGEADRALRRSTEP